MEIEYKWELTDEQAAREVAAHCCEAVQAQGPRDETLLATYYDTPDLRMKELHGALRLRMENGVGVCCMKLAAKGQRDGYKAREEYEAWKKDAGRARLGQSLRVCPPEKLHLFEFDRELRGAFGSLIPRRAAGHTPGHTVFEKIVPPRTPSGAKESVFFVGDILHALGLQVGHYEFCARFDQDPALAVKTRRDAFLRYKGAWFGAHFPFPGKVGIRRDGDRFTVAADK